MQNRLFVDSAQILHSYRNYCWESIVLWQKHKSQASQKLIERWGSGTTRMASELQTEGFPKPQFESSGGRFKVTFFKQIAAESNFKEHELSARQLLAVNYVKEHGSISNDWGQACKSASWEAFFLSFSTCCLRSSE